MSDYEENNFREYIVDHKSVGLGMGAMAVGCTVEIIGYIEHNALFPAGLGLVLIGTAVSSITLLRNP